MKNYCLGAERVKRSLKWVSGHKFYWVLKVSILRNFERVSSVRIRLNSTAVSSFFLFFAHRSRYAQESHDLQNLREMHPNRCRTESTNSVRILKLQTRTNSSGQFRKFNRKESHSLKFKLCFTSCDHLLL